MRDMTKIYIDGVETRNAIGKIAGRKNGIDKVCKAAGLPSEPINKACLNGFAYPDVVNKYMKAGIPVVISGKPVPSRVKIRHTRKAREGVENPEDKKAPEREPVQITLDNYKEVTRIELMRDLLITKLTEIIEELKNI